MFVVVCLLIYLLATISELKEELKNQEGRIENDIDRVRDWYREDSKRISHLEQGIHYIVFRDDSEYHKYLYLNRFGITGEPCFETDHSSTALKFSLERAKEISKEWGVKAKNTMTGDLID